MFSWRQNREQLDQGTQDDATGDRRPDREADPGLSLSSVAGERPHAREQREARRRVGRRPRPQFDLALHLRLVQLQPRAAARQAPARRPACRGRAPGPCTPAGRLLRLDLDDAVAVGRGGRCLLLFFAAAQGSCTARPDSSAGVPAGGAVGLLAHRAHGRFDCAAATASRAGPQAALDQERGAAQDAAIGSAYQAGVKSPRKPSATPPAITTPLKAGRRANSCGARPTGRRTRAG